MVSSYFPWILILINLFSQYTLQHKSLPISSNRLARSTGRVLQRDWKPTVEEALLPLMIGDQPKEELQPPSEEPYNFYLPPFYHDEDYTPKNTLLPPFAGVGSTNYFVTSKPKVKSPKKFIPGRKQVNVRVTAENGQILYNEPLDDFEDYYDDLKPSPSNKQVMPPMPLKYTDYDDNVATPSQNAEQIQTRYQFKGFGGPNSYQFGYDTGKGKNRQFRFEERDTEGNVLGEYGYYDKKKGEMLVTKYFSSKDKGFTIL